MATSPNACRPPTFWIALPPDSVGPLAFLAVAAAVVWLVFWLPATYLCCRGLDPALSIVVLERDGSLPLADPAQAFVEKVDFAGQGDRDAERLDPLGREVPVVLDPDRGFGEPTLSVGVRTDIVAELVAAGEGKGRVAEMHGITVDEVDAAVTYEHGRSIVAA